MSEKLVEFTPARCTRPPLGWFCTRPPGHSGPCAAHTEDDLEKRLRALEDAQRALRYVGVFCLSMVVAFGLIVLSYLITGWETPWQIAVGTLLATAVSMGVLRMGMWLALEKPEPRKGWK